MEGRKVHLCKSQWRLLPGSGHPRGKERTLGLGFRAVRFGDADSLYEQAGKNSHCLATFFDDSALERDPGPRRGNRSRGNAARHTVLPAPLSCLGPRLPSLLPGSFLPGAPVPRCLPLLLHPSRFPTAHHYLSFGIPAVGRALGEFDHLMSEDTIGRRLTPQRWPFCLVSSRPPRTGTNRLFAARATELVLDPGDLLA